MTKSSWSGVQKHDGCAIFFKRDRFGTLAFRLACLPTTSICTHVLEFDCSQSCCGSAASISTTSTTALLSVRKPARLPTLLGLTHDLCLWFESVLGLRDLQTGAVLIVGTSHIYWNNLKVLCSPRHGYICFTQFAWNCSWRIS